MVSNMNYQLVRLFLLLVSAFFVPFIVAGIHMLSFSEILSSKAFDAQLKIFPVMPVTYFCTVASAMFPFAVRGLNTLDGGSARWEEGFDTPAWVFAGTGFLILPLMAVFGPDDSIFQNVLVSRQSFSWTFLVLWWAHGAINAYHVVYERRLEKEMGANARA